MNEVKILNIGGVDQNIKDQYVRDIVAPSENGLDFSTNLPVSSRHYDIGAYLIGQNRQYYEVIAEINVGDTIVVGTNVRATTVSDEIIALKNQSADTVIEIIADKEDGALATHSYAVGKYIYWAYGLTAGLYIVTAAISSGDALVSGEGGNITPANKVCDDIKKLKDDVKFIGNNITNPNLLDNGWFTINQRGVTNAWTTGYGVDRWTIARASVVVQTDKSLNFTWDGTGDFGMIGQFFEDWSVFNGKTVTVSAIIDNKLYSITFPNISEINNYKLFELGTIQLNFSNAWGRAARPLQILIKDTTTHNIKAIKLEIGSVSTLANDSAPNQQQELAKCQRHFYRYNIGGYNHKNVGIAQSSDNVQLLFTTPVPMRTLPAISSSLTDHALCLHNGDNAPYITSFNIYGLANDCTFCVKANSSGLTKGLPYQLYNSGSNLKCLDFVADL